MSGKLRLVQLRHPLQGRKVAIVQGERLRLLDGVDSIYRLALVAIEKAQSLAEALATKESKDLLDYDPIYGGRSEWVLLPAFDHPDEPARCLVTGTGLTHKASAEKRQAMHNDKARPMTDSMRMYQEGLAGGRPAPGQIGVQPEWFYKGNGAILRAHGEPLEVPCFGMDGGEEAEVAGAYIIGVDGTPRRIGLMLGNEFSDHKMESRNYLCLAHSKLRTCALGPELVLGPEFVDVRGQVRLLRGTKIIWSESFSTGEQNMSHTLANLEHHHFKYREHRRPGDVHIHFFGADVFSFGSGVGLLDGDVMELELTGFGRALRNPLRADTTAPQRIAVRPL
jgi:hypothetical protein